MATETEKIEEVNDKTKNDKKLIVYNDNVNSFNFVILVLQKICGHSLQQAEQCTLLIHHNGKCTVKQGEFDDLLVMYNHLSNNNITCEIQ